MRRHVLRETREHRQVSLFLSNQHAAGRSVGNSASADLPVWTHFLFLRGPLPCLPVMIKTQGKSDVTQSQSMLELAKQKEGIFFEGSGSAL